MKRFVLIVLNAGFFLCFPQRVMANEPTTITIFHTNDQHGYVRDEDGHHHIGIDRIAGWKANVPNSMLIDVGDAFYGSSFANQDQGENIVELMNEAGYDLMVPGNHDFTYGWKHLQSLATTASFPMLTSNIYDQSRPFLNDTVIRDVQGIRIGFFGIVSEETMRLEDAKKWEGLTFQKPMEAAGRSIEALKQQNVDIIIGLSHLGMDEKEDVDMCADIAKAYPEIDVLIDGHSHHVLPKGQLINQTLIVQAGKHEHYLGKLTITLDDEKQIIQMNDHLINYEESKQVDVDPKVHALLQAMNGSVDKPVAQFHNQEEKLDITMNHSMTPWIIVVMLLGTSVISGVMVRQKRIHK